MDNEYLYQIIKELMYFIFLMILCVNNQLSGELVFGMLFVRIVIELIVLFARTIMDY